MMRSLQWRMLAALTLVIMIAWAISIGMFVSYLTPGSSNAWRAGMASLGDSVASVLPKAWVRPLAPASTDVSHEEAKSTSVSGPMPRPTPRYGRLEPGRGSILTALVLNTAELGIVGLLMWWAVVTSLRPLRSISDGLSRRRAFDPQPLPAHQVPTELRPLISAFNSLLGRVDQAMNAERQFIADAAHELRTPLAALHVQADVALGARTIDDKDDAIRKLLDISHRTHRLADQLLDLARLDAGLHAVTLQSLNLLDVCQHVLSEFSVQANMRGTQLVLTGEGCLARCDIDEIGILIRNLVDNALIHGQDGGVVEVHCGYIVRDQQRRPVIHVQDDGPGIDATEHEAVFSRFYRGKDVVARGSGIGLALVASVAKLHDAHLETGQGPAERGFLVRVILPAV